MTTENNNKQTLEFQAETKQLLDLMINSIYTNREIFLRELISNASDAIDKAHFASLTDHTNSKSEEFEIYLIPDKDNKTLTISDNGIGMTYEEVISNIGTIAQSGTKSFLEKMADNQENSPKELIGQFGVGFYSAFMVADKVTLITKKRGEDKAVRWESAGDGTYTIEACEKETPGTILVLNLNEKYCKDDNYEENFVNQYNLQRLVKKYSDYIRYPIKMNFEETAPSDEENKEPQTTIELRTLNSMKPLWCRSKNEITAEEYNQAYKDMFHGWEDPLEVIHSKVEGTVEYTSLLYIPAHAPMDFYHKEAQEGIQLYCKNVFIMENCKDLLPDYLRFMRGLVDSPDFSLNISREILQQSQQLKKIGKALENNIFKTLENMLKNDKEKYNKFWNEYGKAIKSGVYSDFSNKKKLEKLLIFPSSNSETELTTLDEYLERMPEKQKVIYYAAGKDRSFVESLPQMELLKEKNIEVLYLFDKVDEFAIDSLKEYKDKKFQSISRGNLELDEFESEETKKQNEEKAKENKSLLEAVKNHLGAKISEVKISNRLKTSPVCLVSGDQGISLTMEQILAEIDQSNNMFKASRILELNPEHTIFKKLKSLYENNAEGQEFKDYCDLLYGQALLIEGLPLDNPSLFAEKVASLMVK
ncbi:MAG: molecular chaperone HtpG [bacterium]